MQPVTFTIDEIETPAPTGRAGPVTFRAEDIDSRPPDFRVANEPPSPSMWELAGETGKSIVSNLNPLPLLSKLYDEESGEVTKLLEAQRAGRPLESVYHGIAGSPFGVVLKALGGLTRAQLDQFSKGAEAYRQGRYSEAAGYTAAGLLPVGGPMAAYAGEQIGTGEPREMARGVGTATVALGPSAVKYGVEAVRTGSLAPGAAAVRAATPVPTPRPSRLNPAEAAAVAFARQHDIPLDVATATGSPAVRVAQHRAARGIGEPTATRFLTTQQEALAREGQRLAAEAAPGAPAVTPEQAGAGVQTATRGLITDLHTAATDAYDRLRQLETKHTTRVALAPQGSKAFQRLQAKLAAGLGTGQTPSVAELTVMRQLEAELDAMPFSQRRLQPTQYGGSLEHVPGTGGAGTPVYHEILQAAPGTADMTRAEVQAAIRKTRETGEWTNASRGAYDVARQRVQSGQVGGSALPAGAPILGGSERMALAIDLKQSKAALQPIYQRLLRESQLAPLMGGKAEALRALDRLMRGPDVAPLSVVDAALGDLKAIARTDLPELRTQGQSIAAQAVKALDQQVRARAAAAGPEVLAALEEGRGATVGKYQTAGVLEQLRTEPVQLFRQLTAPQDSAITLLRQVRDIAPAQLETIGRAYLENLMSMATAEGGFGRAARLQAEWQKLGPETKRILFADPALRQNLDHFFLLAKKMAENPNPSGTAHTAAIFNIVAQGESYLAAKLLYTPAGARAMTRLLAANVRLPKGATRSAAQTVATLNVIHAARKAGVDVPKAAERKLLVAQ
jgi:hypothetical protein